MLRKISFALTLTFLVCLRASAQDRSTPEATVRSFLSAFEHADLKQAAACVKGAQSGGAVLDALAEQIKKEPATLTLTDAKTTLKGTSATVTGQVSAKSDKSPQAQNFATQVNLTSSGGAWLIVPDAAKAKQNTNPDLVNGLAYTLTNTHEVVGRANVTARAVACLSNMKQICLGAIMFLQDYDEKFQLKATSYKKSIQPYIKNEAVFKCPADSSGAVSYAFNANLAGVAMAKIHAPAETVLIYEGKNGKLNFRHEGKASVGFADGHAKLVDAAGAKKLRWKP
jgi:prepilin-type processing-associated H-X9-DG protein